MNKIFSLKISMIILFVLIATVQVDAATLIGGLIKNGDFNSNPGTSVDFANTSEWYNLGSGGQTAGATKDNLAKVQGLRTRRIPDHTMWGGGRGRQSPTFWEGEGWRAPHIYAYMHAYMHICMYAGMRAYMHNGEKRRQRKLGNYFGGNKNEL